MTFGKQQRTIHTAREAGFTLIELLVVIAIIGLLASIILASLNTARAKGRDARRIGDINQLRTALELYASDHNGAYPPSPNANTASLSTDLAVLAPQYIPVIPKDPSRTNDLYTGYRYCADANGFAVLVDSEKTNTWCGLSMGNNACLWNQEDEI